MKSFFILIAISLIGCGSDSGTSPGPRPTPDMDIDLPEPEPDMPEPEPDLPQSPQRLALDTEELLFEGVEIGQTRTLTFAVSNLGGRDLVIQGATISQFNRTSNPEFKPGSKWISGTTIIEGQTFREFEVEYSPTDHQADRGMVTILSNDPTQTTWTVRLETINPYPDLQGPQLLRFGNVESGTSSTQRVNLYNRGANPLTITAITKTGAGPFAVELIPTEPLPRVIQRNELYAFDVVYSPANDSVHRATVTVSSNDPDDPEFEIAVSGNDPTACLQVLPTVVDFGEIPGGSSRTQEVTLFNCSNLLPLTVSALEVIDGAHVFSLEDLPALPLTLSGFERTTFDVKATLPGGEAIGILSIQNNDANALIDLRVRTPD